MVTYQAIAQSIETDGKTQAKIAGACLSGDTKPTDVDNGSVMLEMDTGKVYFFDEENSQWREFV